MNILVQFADYPVPIHFRSEGGQIQTLAACPICGNSIYSEDCGLGRAHAMNLAVNKMQTHLRLWHDLREITVSVPEFPNGLGIFPPSPQPRSQA